METGDKCDKCGAVLSTSDCRHCGETFWYCPDCGLVVKGCRCRWVPTGGNVYDDGGEAR